MCKIAYIYVQRMNIMCILLTFYDSFIDIHDKQKFFNIMFMKVSVINIHDSIIVFWILNVFI